MLRYLSVVCALCVLVAMTNAAPATLEQQENRDIAVNGQVGQKVPTVFS